MDEMLGQAMDEFALYWLVVARVSGIFFAVPIFGHRSIPPTVRVGFGLLTALAILPLLQVPAGGIPDQLLEYVLLLAREIVFGLALGFLVALVFAAVEMAGQILDMEMGFGMVNILDPILGHPLPVMGNFLHILALLLFFLVDGHHLVMVALVESFQQVGPGGGMLGDAGLRIGLEHGTWLFFTALKIAAPVLAVLFLITVVLGFLGRAAPQLNIFIVGIPVKVGVGLLALAIAMPVYVLAMRALFPQAYQSMALLLRTVGP